MVNEYGESGGLQHLDVYVGVPARENRKPPSLIENVLRLARANVEVAESVLGTQGVGKVFRVR
jgi:hypothetical protein